MAMIFQVPMTSLNPVHTIGRQIVEAIRAHTTLSAAAARDRAIQMLELVRIPSAASRFDDFPHLLSAACANGLCSPWHWPASRNC
jgi:peptide/nickel transport system ATP-binding protein